MTDPCWLPSAIMQTTGAMLGIYAAIYILFAREVVRRTEFLTETIHDIDKMKKEVFERKAEYLTDAILDKMTT